MAFRFVLCATDLSEGSAVAVREADRIARADRARFGVIWVVPAPPLHVVDPLRAFPPEAAELATGAAAMEALKESVAGLIGRDGPPPELWVEPGQPARTVVDRVRELGADLLVVGARGRSGLRTVLMGSVTDHVLRHAPSAVLVARDNAADGPVVAATDFSDSARRAVHVAVREANRRGARLTLLHSVGVFRDMLVTAGMPIPVSPPVPAAPSEVERSTLQREAGRRLATLQAELDVPCDVVTAEWDPVPDVIDHATQSKASLIVMGRVGRSGVERLLIGSVTEEIARSAPCSVLAVP